MSEPLHKTRKYSKKTKKVTGHQKVPPLKAIERHHKGPIEVKYIEDKFKRSKAMSTRKDTLFGKARELEIMTGAKVKLQVSYLGVTDVYETEKEVNEEQEPGNSQPAMPAANDPSMSPSQIQLEVRELVYTDKGVQVAMGDKITDLPGIDRQCSICGADYEKDTKTQQNTWMGCDTPRCKYWVHANCMLGTKKKLTKGFVAKIPFNCPIHR